ncbi:MAG: site-2 protease family protein, partial [Planctomycetales bacterium]|nr:site-2 protease family protein [Planctomycetales bacterium]
MRDRWSIALLRRPEAEVRLHIFLFLAAACTLYLSWLAGQSGAVEGDAWLVGAGLMILAGALAIHCGAHLRAASQLGLRCEPLVIGPLGDLATEAEFADPRRQMIVSAAGPAANFAAALLCLAMLTALGLPAPWRLLQPLSPGDMTSGPLWLASLKIATWVNATMAIVNLLPALPMDGGRILHSTLMQVHPTLSGRRAALLTARSGVAVGLCLLVCAWLLKDADSSLAAPPWFLLLLLGVVVLFSVQFESVPRGASRAEEDELFGYDFS